MPLLIKTHLKEAKHKGIGLISSQYIKEGTVVYRDNLLFDRLFTKKDVESMDSVLKEFVRTYCSFNKEDDAYYLCMDNSRFMNHSFTPNLTWNEITKEYTANDNIREGEELTCNYTEFDELSKDGDLGFEVYN